MEVQRPSIDSGQELLHTTDVIWCTAPARLLTPSLHRTAVEVQRIVDNVMEALMDMRLRLPVAVVEHLTGGVDDAIQKLTTNVLYHVGSADVLVPPVPPLTRYEAFLDSLTAPSFICHPACWDAEERRLDAQLLRMPLSMTP